MNPISETTFIAIEAIVLSVQVAMTALMWIMKREFVTKHELAKVEKTLSEACTEIRLLQNDGKYGMRPADLARVSDKVSDVDLKVENLTGEFSAMSRQLGLILETLIERAS